MTRINTIDLHFLINYSMMIKVRKKMKVNAIYQPSFGQYRGNPLIEALPPIRNFNDIKTALKCTVDISPLEKHEPGVVRSHLISQLMNSFFCLFQDTIHLSKSLAL